MQDIIETDELHYKSKVKRIKKQLKKSLFKNDLGLFFSATEKVLINFKSRLFQTKILDNIPTG